MNSDLHRCAQKIEQTVIRFCVGAGQFHIDELRQFVEAHTGPIAPDSPGRILRQLRKRGIVSYEIVNRSQSLYRINHLQRQGVLFE
jgi:hypothetical protein